MLNFFESFADFQGFLGVYKRANLYIVTQICLVCSCSWFIVNLIFFGPIFICQLNRLQFVTKFSDARKMGDISRVSSPLTYKVVVFVCEHTIYYGQGSCITGVLLCR
jgi:hypothetical protein